MIKVLVVDDQEVVRQGIANLLRFQPDLEIVGEAADGKQALAMAERHRPDVVLMDIRMPVLNGIEATAAILEADRTAKILILTTFDDDELIVDALKAGASGYLLKDTPSDQIASAVRSVNAGNTLLGPAAAIKMRDVMNSAKSSKRLDVSKLLTNREIEILVLIGQGKNNTEIANTLHIAEGTVKNHISRIFAQINARDRVQAALMAQELSL
jgi:DNA-binding NarL/FixJ family response regulator